MPVFETKPGHRGEAVDLGLAVNVTQEAAGLGAGRARDRVHPHAAHERHVEHQSSIAHGKSGDVVTAALDGQSQAALACEVHARHDVGNPEAAHDERRPPVDHGVPKGARFVVAGIPRG